MAQIARPRRDQHRRAGRHVAVKPDHRARRHLHAPVGGRAAEHADIRRAMDIDMPAVGIDRTPLVPTRLQPFEPQDAGENELAGGRVVGRIHRPGGRPRRRLIAEHRVRPQTGPDLPRDAKRTDRRAIGIHPLTDAAQRGRNGPGIGAMPVAEQIQPLAGDIDRDEIGVVPGMEPGADGAPVVPERPIAPQNGDLAAECNGQMRARHHGAQHVRRRPADRKGTLAQICVRFPRSRLGFRTGRRKRAEQMRIFRNDR